MGHAEVAVAGVVVVEVPFLVWVDGFVAAGAGGFACVDERGDGCAASLVCVAPATAGCGPGRFSSAGAGRHQRTETPATANTVPMLQRMIGPMTLPRASVAFIATF